MQNIILKQYRCRHKNKHERQIAAHIRLQKSSEFFIHKYLPVQPGRIWPMPCKLPILSPYYLSYYSKDGSNVQPFFFPIPVQKAACRGLSKFFCVQKRLFVVYYGYKRQAGGPEHIGNIPISTYNFSYSAGVFCVISGRYGALGTTDGCFVVLPFLWFMY